MPEVWSSTRSLGTRVPALCQRHYYHQTCACRNGCTTARAALGDYLYVVLAAGMNHKRRRPKNARAGCLMCKPWKVNGASKARPEDVTSQSPGTHTGVCKGKDSWHDSHDWGVPFYEVFDYKTHQRYRRTNPFFAPKSCFSWWQRECQRCGKVEYISKEEALAAYQVDSPYGVPPIKKASVP